MCGPSRGYGDSSDMITLAAAEVKSPMLAVDCDESNRISGCVFDSDRHKPL